MQDAHGWWKVTAATVLLSAVFAAGSAPALAQGEAEVALETANKLAAKGKLGQAVPYYKKVIELAPQAHPLAYFNLAEVQKVRGNCDEALLMFQLYASLQNTKEAREEVGPGVAKCKGEDLPRLAIKASAGQPAKVRINGILASVDGVFGPAPLPPGEYVVELEAVDHHPVSEKITLDADGATLEKTLEKMLFSGKILVESSVPGARVRIYEGPNDKTKVLFDLRAPMKAGVEVPEGRHFVEVTANGYDRWIRNVSVGRDDLSVVRVSLTKSKPPELK